MMYCINPTAKDSTISYIAIPTDGHLANRSSYCNYTNVVSDKVFEALSSNPSIDNFSSHLENELMLGNYGAKLIFKRNEILDFFKAEIAISYLYFCTDERGMFGHSVFFFVKQSVIKQYSNTYKQYVTINVDDVNK